MKVMWFYDFYFLFDHNVGDFKHMRFFSLLRGEKLEQNVFTHAIRDMPAEFNSNVSFLQFKQFSFTLLEIRASDCSLN